jgi:hypothetical protein
MEGQRLYDAKRMRRGLILCRRAIASTVNYDTVADSGEDGPGRDGPGTAVCGFTGVLFVVEVLHDDRDWLICWDNMDWHAALIVLGIIQ